MSFLEAARWSPHCGCRQRGTKREGCLILQGASSQMAVNSFGESWVLVVSSQRTACSSFCHFIALGSAGSAVRDLHPCSVSPAAPAQF